MTGYISVIKIKMKVKCILIFMWMQCFLFSCGKPTEKKNYFMMSLYLWNKCLVEGNKNLLRSQKTMQLVAKVQVKHITWICRIANLLHFCNANVIIYQRSNRCSDFLSCGPITLLQSITLLKYKCNYILFHLCIPRTRV